MRSVLRGGPTNAVPLTVLAVLRFWLSAENCGPRDGLRCVRCEPKRTIDKYAFRGGSWSFIDAQLRHAARSKASPSYRYGAIGIRCVRQQTSKAGNNK